MEESPNSKLDFEPDEMDGRYLGSISTDFVKVSDYLKEASYQIRTKGFSEYPIFVLSKIPQPIGKVLYAAFELGNSWHYYASLMEEFTQRGLIGEPDAFRKSYKNPDEYCCLFIVDEEFVNFVYLPYPED